MTEYDTEYIICSENYKKERRILYKEQRHNNMSCNKHY